MGNKIIDGNIEWIKDADTGEVIGYKDAKGLERYLVGVENNLLTGGLEFNGIPMSSVMANAATTGLITPYSIEANQAAHGAYRTYKVILTAEDEICAVRVHTFNGMGVDLTGVIIGVGTQEALGDDSGSAADLDCATEAYSYANTTSTTIPTVSATTGLTGSRARPSIHSTAWMSIKSKPRTDLALYPNDPPTILHINWYAESANANLMLAPVSATSPARDRATMNGRVVRSWVANAEHALRNRRNGFSAAAGKAKATLFPVIFVEYLTKSKKIVTVMSVGDSITAGSAAGPRTCWANAVDGLRALAPSFGFSHVNAGFGGQNRQQYAMRMQDMLVAGLLPDVVAYSGFSPNDYIAVNPTPAGTEVVYDTAWNALDFKSFYSVEQNKALLELRKKNIPVILSNGMPCNYTITGYPQRRVWDADRLYQRDLINNSGYVVADWSTPMSSGVPVPEYADQEAMKTGLHADGIHPNVAGHLAMTPNCLAALRQVVAI